MESLLISCLVLFIVGVVGTLVYDKYKDSALAKLKEVTTPRPKPEGVQRPKSRELDDLINEVHARARRGQSTIQVQNGHTTQTMSVQDLIKRLEQMKKNI